VIPQTRITIRNDLGEKVTLIVGALVNEIDYQETP
jgi:hypothetical protein